MQFGKNVKFAATQVFLTTQSFTIVVIVLTLLIFMGHLSNVRIMSTMR